MKYFKNRESNERKSSDFRFRCKQAIRIWDQHVLMAQLINSASKLPHETW